MCGDAYHQKNQAHVYPGKYANGIITKTYKQGQQITVLIDVTSNHRGSFKFRIGPIGKPPITEEKLTHLLRQPNGATSWQIPQDSSNEVFSVQLLLPPELSCNHCVLRWWWKTGNSWGCDDTGCGLGKGERQETFVNCADVKIMPNGGPLPTQSPTKPPVDTLPPVTTTPPTQPPEPGMCKANGPWTGNVAMDDWCRRNCAAGFCPSEQCTCQSPTQTQVDTQPPVAVMTTQSPEPGVCKASGPWTGNEAMDKWCRDNCAVGFCPSEQCTCS